MKKNIRFTDRMVRLLFAVAVAVLYFMHAINGMLAIVLGIVAVILAVTAFTGFCPLYYILGITTKKKSSQ